MFVELGYEIFHNMPVAPGLPGVEVNAEDAIENGDDWNGSVLSMYLHSGTHVDAPVHFIKDGPSIDEIPIDRFIYKAPLLIDIPCDEGQYITAEDIMKSSGENLRKADILFLNTGFWKVRKNNFEIYVNNAPSLSPEAADFIRNKLPNLQAIAIDATSVEDLDKGALEGYKVHEALLDPNYSNERTLLIYEDYNPEPIINKQMVSAFVTPLRIVGKDAAPVNIVAEVK